jgi:hypothetical protein
VHGTHAMYRVKIPRSVGYQRASAEDGTTQASAMSTETSILDFFASVKITPLTGGTSP